MQLHVLGSVYGVKCVLSRRCFSPPVPPHPVATLLICANLGQMLFWASESSNTWVCSCFRPGTASVSNAREDIGTSVLRACWCGSSMRRRLTVRPCLPTRLPEQSRFLSELEITLDLFLQPGNRKPGSPFNQWDYNQIPITGDAVGSV